ncbi:MAG: CsbD family protein [Dehalococcoidia bacterium]
MADLKTEGQIERARGRIRSTWGDLTDDDFEQAKGDSENLIGRIKEKTGDTIENIRTKLDGLLSAEDG